MRAVSRLVLRLAPGGSRIFSAQLAHALSESKDEQAGLKRTGAVSACGTVNLGVRTPVEPCYLRFVPPEREHLDEYLPRPAQFATTHWSVVLLAGQGDSPRATEALEKLCRTYWYPLYAYVRRRGYDTHEAQDLTQEFFARFLESHALRDVSPQKGRFRSLLLASLNHFLANEWKRTSALKHGGGFCFLSLDQAAAEDRYRLEPISDSTPEKIFERRWALTLLDQVLTRLREECAAGGKAALFDQLRGFLADVSGPTSYAEVTSNTGLNEAAARQAVRRLRQRYRELMRAEIAHTVSSPQEIDEEIRHLFATFAR